MGTQKCGGLTCPIIFRFIRSRELGRKCRSLAPSFSAHTFHIDPIVNYVPFTSILPSFFNHIDRYQSLSIMDEILTLNQVQVQHAMCIHDPPKSFKIFLRVHYFTKLQVLLIILSQNYRFKPPFHKTTHFVAFHHKICVNSISKP
jgi:hypothetical protein